MCGCESPKTAFEARTVFAPVNSLWAEEMLAETMPTDFTHNSNVWEIFWFPFYCRRVLRCWS